MEEEATLLYDKGVGLIYQGLLIEALEAINHAIQLDANYVLAYHGKGNVLYELHSYQEALETYEQAIQLDANYVLAYYGKGNVLHSLQRYQEALEAYEQAIQLDTNFVPAYHGKGNVLHELHSYQEALEAYEQAIRLDANFVRAYHGKCIALRELHSYQEALEVYEQAIRLDANFVPAYHGKGNVLHELHSYQEALETYEQAIQLDANFVLAYYGKGQTYRELSKNNIFLLKNAQQNFLRAYILKEHNQTFLNRFPLSIYFSFFDQDDHSPLFLAQLFIDFPFSQKYTSFHLLHQRVNQTLIWYISLLSQINKHFQADSKHVHLYQAVLTYLLGNPIEAFRILDEVVDAEFEESLQGQFYYSLSAQDILEPNADNILKFAIDNANSYIQTIAKEEEQSYYAGKLLFLAGRYKEALLFFATYSDQFLPSHYMEVFMLDKLSQEEKLGEVERFEYRKEKEDRIESLLQREYEFRDKPEGFLKGWQFNDLDLSTREGIHHLDQCIYYNELDEAIQMVFGYMDEYLEKNYPPLSPDPIQETYSQYERRIEKLLLDKPHWSPTFSYSRHSESIRETLSFSESYIDKIKKELLTIEPEQVETLASHLKERFQSRFDRIKDACPLDKSIAELVETDLKYALERNEKVIPLDYFRLTLYFMAVHQIDAETKFQLDLYTALKYWALLKKTTPFQFVSEELFKMNIDEYTKNSLTSVGIISATIASPVLSIGISYVWGRFAEYFNRDRKHIAELTYMRYQEEYIDLLDEYKETLEKLSNTSDS